MRRAWRRALVIADALASVQRRLGTRHQRYARVTHALARLSAYSLSGDARFKNFLDFVNRGPTDTPPSRTSAPPPTVTANGTTGIPSAQAIAQSAVSYRRLQLHRAHAIGDVLYATPLLPEIREKYPDAKITFTTLFPETLKGNPYVDEVIRAERPLPGYDHTIAFDYELTPDLPRHEAYAKCAGVFATDATPQLYLDIDELERANEILAQNGIDLIRPICAFHMTSGWSVRDWPLPYFELVARELISAGIQIILLGEQANPEVTFGTDLRGKTNIREVFAIISKCTMMLAIDSSLLHVATAFRVPVVSLFGCTDPEKVLPAWAQANSIYSDIVCRGCHHRQRPVPAIFAPVCPWESVRCMIGIKPELVLARLRTILDAATKPKVSIVIPHYNKFDLTNACLQSIFRYGARCNFEVLVIDNCSTNDSAMLLSHWVPRIRLLRNKEMSVFAFTCNAGLTAARGEYVLFLNNDTTVTKGWLDELCAVLDGDPNVGLVGPKLLYPGSNAIQHCGSVVNDDGIVEHLYQLLPANFAAANRRRSFRLLTGACLMGRRNELLAFGGFDTVFKMACEDTDLCLKYYTANKKIIYCPASTVFHHEGATRGRRPIDDPDDNYNRGLLRKRWSKLLVGDASDYRLLAEIEAGEQKTWLCLNEVPAEIRSKYDSAENRQVGRYPFRCEIGSGMHPEPGYIHIDVMADAPSIDIVHDITKPLPLMDNIVGEILANHVIEHVSWRKLPALVREFYRVAAPGGRVLIRTPNLRFISEYYLSGKVTPEHPRDETEMQTLYGNITPGMWANIKLFAGQDYPSNFHYLCMDPHDLQALFLNVGFSTASLERFGRDFSPGEIQLVAIK